MNAHINIKTFFLILSASSSLMFCTSDYTPSKVKKTGSTVAGDADALQSLGSQGVRLSQIFEYIEPKKNITVADLASSSFRITSFIVSRGTNVRSSFPVLQFKVPVDADYVQILRCPAGAASIPAIKNSILSGSGSFSGWDALTNQGCEDLSRSGISGSVDSGGVKGTTSFVDHKAPTKTDPGYRWVARACVDVVRMVGATSTTNRCSNFVAITDQDYPHRNYRREEVMKAFEEAERHRDEVDRIGRSLPMLATKLNNELAKCKDKKEEYEKRIKQKSGILKFVELGLNVTNSIMKDFSVTGLLDGLDQTALLKNETAQRTLAIVNATVGPYGQQSVSQTYSNIKAQNPGVGRVMGRAAGIETPKSSNTNTSTQPGCTATSCPKLYAASTDDIDTNPGPNVPTSTTTATNPSPEIEPAGVGSDTATQTSTGSPIVLPSADIQSAFNDMITAPLEAAGQFGECHGETAVMKVIETEQKRLEYEKLTYDFLRETALAVEKTLIEYENTAVSQ